ncbi:MAG: hypothetical protein ABWW69_02295 [Pyrodictiaceae archaeon]
MGSLAYGGELHGLLAGTVFAGLARARGLSLARCNNLLLSVEASTSLLGELYHVDPAVLQLLDSRLGLQRRSISVSVAGVNLIAETHIAPKLQCTPLSQATRYLRMLLALPPHLPPPVQPLAAYPARLVGYEPCHNAMFYCLSLGSSYETALVDIVISPRLLRDWLEENRAGLGGGVAEAPSGLRLYPLVLVPRPQGVRSLDEL